MRLPDRQTNRQANGSIHNVDAIYFCKQICKTMKKKIPFSLAEILPMIICLSLPYFCCRYAPRNDSCFSYTNKPLDVITSQPIPLLAFPYHAFSSCILRLQWKFLFKIYFEYISHPESISSDSV